MRPQTARTASLSPSLWTAPRRPQVSREQLEPFLGLLAVAVEGSHRGSLVRGVSARTGDSGPLRGQCRVQGEGDERSCVGRVHLLARPARDRPAVGRRDCRCGETQKAASFAPSLAPASKTHGPSKIALRFLGVNVVAETKRWDSRPSEPSTRGRGTGLPSHPGQTGRAKRGLGGDRGAFSWRLSCPSPHRHFWAAQLRPGQEDSPSEAGV